MLATSLTISERRAVAAGPLAPLAESLAADLDRLLPDEDVFIPAEKARMTRQGGRCPRDGAFLAFDPRTPRQHRCPTCGTVCDGDDHYRWWIMGYQLWLAERAVHASALWRLTGTTRYQRLSESILLKLAERYLVYPNEDNVLGPTRVFFSTYLESIWTLQLSVAVSLLEDEGTSATGGLVRDRILSPSSTLISSFNEGLSNRQVWNSAALGAAGVLLDNREMVAEAISGPGGLKLFLRSGLLHDGSWYEGENYHLFAHRGLWYLVMMADYVGAQPAAESVARFDLGFTAPLKTALPDFTVPARRDSQYRASLRQWRIAESVELGLSRVPESPELAAGLSTLYADAPAGDSARWRSTAEAERNVGAVRLTRADLGWKSLLFATPRIPATTPHLARSALMAGQGFAVARRDNGRLYVALDYGHTGGSHGHPDRLNLWLVIGDRRVFEDFGTGSYVERTLHWYRSTLAHNAPLVDGRSQDPVAGHLRAWDEREGYTWIDAEASAARNVLVRRTVVVADGYLVDRLEWNANREVTFDLPMHIDGAIDGATWEARPLDGGAGLEDGFAFVSETETAKVPEGLARITAPGTDGSVHVELPHAWWRAVAPGPPGQDARRFLMVRARGERGRITSAWSWDGPVELNLTSDGALDVTVKQARFRHRLDAGTWRIEASGAAEVILDGRQETLAIRVGAKADADPNVISNRQAQLIPVVTRREVSPGDLMTSREGLHFELGRAHYRRTEASWEEAGSPSATVAIGATDSELLVEVSVNNRQPNFAPAQADNPLDNEHPDTNSDGVQLHLSNRDRRSLAASWLMVPEPGSPHVRINGRDGASQISLRASWRQTSEAWQLLARIPRDALGPSNAQIALDVIVNEMPRGRERRRGQLVLSGGNGWAYLRGDRQELGRLLPFMVRNV